LSLEGKRKRRKPAGGTQGFLQAASGKAGALLLSAGDSSAGEGTGENRVIDSRATPLRVSKRGGKIYYGW